MKVTIIILNWNGKEDTTACIQSILSAGVSLADILVVDNCSEDGSVEELGGRFFGINILTTEENLGYTGGNNAGIRHALSCGSDIILLLNNDTEVTPGFLSPLIEAFRRDPAAGVAGSLVLFHGSDDVVWFGNPHIDIRTGRIWDDAYGRRYDGHPVPMQVPFVSGCSMALSRSLLEKIGLFDESFFCYAEELDLCLRANAAGFTVLLVPESKIYHKVSGSTGGGRSGKTMYYRVRNQLLCMKKNLPLGFWPSRVLRDLLIILIHLAALWRLEMGKWEGIREIARGVRDFYSGRTGRAARLW